MMPFGNIDRPLSAGRCSAYVHNTPDADELAAIRRSSETGLPYGENTWIDRLCRRLKLDLTIRPRGRPQKGRKAMTNSSAPFFTSGECYGR